jgi:hypothetical protein
MGTEVTVTDRDGKPITFMPVGRAFPLQIAFNKRDGVVAVLQADGTVSGDYKKFVRGLRELPETETMLGLHLWAVANALAQQNCLSPLDV